MAKHDQRILKFLTQNAERAPTITDMMTRLNISISDISASLNSLMAQGMVSKRTNGQGIECWFPTNGTSPQLGAGNALDYAQEPRGGEPDRRGAESGRISSSRFSSPLGNPAPPEPAPLPPLQPTLSLSASTAFPASLTATSSPAPAALGQRPAAMESAVFAASPAAIAAAAQSAPSRIPEASAPAPASEALPGITPPVGHYSLAPVKSGIGFMTFTFGLILTAAASVYFSNRLLKKDFDSASRSFVDRPTWDKAMASAKTFEGATKNHVKSLEAEVKALTAQVAAMKAANDSLQAVAAQQAEQARKAEAAVAKKPASKRRR